MLSLEYPSKSACLVLSFIKLPFSLLHAIINSNSQHEAIGKGKRMISCEWRLNVFFYSYCYGLILKCSLKEYMLKAWSQFVPYCEGSTTFGSGVVAET